MKYTATYVDVAPALPRPTSTSAEHGEPEGGHWQVSFSDGTGRVLSLSDRDVLEQHRSSPSCAPSNADVGNSTSTKDLCHPIDRAGTAAHLARR